MLLAHVPEVDTGLIPVIAFRSDPVNNRWKFPWVKDKNVLIILYFQKAKGDTKKKGRPDPYTYVPLDHKALNKRYSYLSYIYLGDNCILNFHLGRYIIGYTVVNLV